MTSSCHQLRMLVPSDLDNENLSSRDVVRMLRRARPIRHARTERLLTSSSETRKTMDDPTPTAAAVAQRTCIARAFARGAGASSRRPHPASPGATYFRSLEERLYAEAKTPAQNTFRFSISGDPYLHTPAISDTTVQFFRPQGAYRCDARWASAGNVTRVVAGVNDVLRYRWVDGTDHAVALTPSNPEDPRDFYDIYRLNADLQRAMLANRHFVTTKFAPDAPQYLLRIQFDVRTGHNVVLAFVYRRADLDNGDVVFGFFGDDENALAHPTRKWIAESDVFRGDETLLLYPRVLADDSERDVFATRALGMIPGTTTAAASGDDDDVLAMDPLWALPALRTHLPLPSRVTSNTPVMPHFYSNRAFSVSGGSVDASLNQFRRKVNTINSAAASLEGTIGFGPALARTLAYQKSMQFPWTRKQTYQNPRTLCDVNCRIRLADSF